MHYVVALSRSWNLHLACLTNHWKSSKITWSYVCTEIFLHRYCPHFSLISRRNSIQHNDSQGFCFVLDSSYPGEKSGYVTADYSVLYLSLKLLFKLLQFRNTKARTNFKSKELLLLRWFDHWFESSENLYRMWATDAY